MLVFSSYGSGELWQVKARFQALLSVAAEQQPCGVQVVEWVGLVFQYTVSPLGDLTVLSQ